MKKMYLVSEPFWSYSDEGYYIDNPDNVNKSSVKVFDDIVKAKAYARDLDENISKVYLTDLCYDYRDFRDSSESLLSTITEIEVE
jgi:hypothetical protein